jgi:hypothetical protein
MPLAFHLVLYHTGLTLLEYMKWSTNRILTKFSSSQDTLIVLCIGIPNACLFVCFRSFVNHLSWGFVHHSRISYLILLLLLFVSTCTFMLLALLSVFKVFLFTIIGVIATFRLFIFPLSLYDRTRTLIYNSGYKSLKVVHYIWEAG